MPLAKLTEEVPVCEKRIDDAIVAVSTLIATMVNARQQVDVPAATGQGTILRVAKAQMSLIDASSNVLRAHTDLVKIGQEKAGFDIHPECPKTAGSAQRHLTAVA